MLIVLLAVRVCASLNLHVSVMLTFASGKKVQSFLFGGNGKNYSSSN